MKTEYFASIVLPFEHLDFLVQIGDNITESTPLFIVCVGRLFGQEERQVFVQKVELTGPDGSSDLTLLTVDCPKDSKNFLGIQNLPTASLTSMSYDPLSKLLMVTTSSSSEPTLLAIEPTLVDFIAFKQEDTLFNVASSERLLGLK